MLPELNATGSVYTRNNADSTFGSNLNGTPSNVVSFGSDRTLRSYRTAAKWNLLDLGMGYVNARQEGERMLIAEEESRKELQQLIQDIRVTYWRAYSAQQLMPKLAEFQRSLQQIKTLLSKALQDKMVPKEELLNQQALLLDGQRRYIQLESKLKTAQQELRHLINLKPNEPLYLKKPSIPVAKIHNLEHLDFEKLDAITLVNRPELRSQDYQRRIAKLGTKTAILQALPSLTLNAGRNFNSNSFLVNNFWNDKSIESSWNILNLAALPVSLKTAETQTKYESLKLMALTLGALNETRITFSHYQSLAKECVVANTQTENARRMYKLLQDRKYANLANDQEVILAKLHFLFAQMDEILLLSDLASTLGDLYLSVGFDVLPLATVNTTSKDVLCVIERNLKMQETLDFKHYVNITYGKLFNAHKGKIN
jgi:outer membrane protein TolC